MAQNKQTVVVFGATGQQGGSIIRAMKDDERFILKAATRNTESESAKKLAAQGIQVINVDMEDAASCKAALEGAYGAFLVTSFLEHFDWDREVLQGKNVVDAAKETGLQHLVFSGLRSPKDFIGKDGCRHMETKKRISDYIIEKGVPYTIVNYAFYYENFATFASHYQKNDNEEYVLDIPLGTAPLDMICTSDAGELIHQVILHPEDYKGHGIPLASDRLTIQEISDILAKKLGRKFVPGQTTVEQYAKKPFPGAEDFAIMFEFMASGKNTHDIDLIRRLHPTILTFEQWVDQNLDNLTASYP